MSIIHSDPLSVQLTFPEHQYKTSLLERLLNRKSKRRQALEEIHIILQQGATYKFESSLQQLSSSPSKTRREVLFDNLDSAHERYAEVTETMEMLDRWETSTLVFIAESYTGGVTDNYSDWLTNVLPMVYLRHAEASGEDLDLIVKNAVSYRLGWSRTCLNAMNDARRSDPALERPDLYNLTGEDREYASNIMEVSKHSQELAYAMIRRGDTGLSDRDKIASALTKISAHPHMTPELALVIKENPERVEHIKNLMKQRWLTATEISADLVRDCLTGSMLLNEGML